MSRASSLTPEEKKNAAIKSAAAISDDLWINDLKMDAVATKIRQCEANLAYIQSQQQALDNGLLALDALNTDKKIIDLVRTKISEGVTAFIAQYKADTAEKNILARFHLILQEDPKNPILQQIDNNRLYGLGGHAAGSSAAQDKTPLVGNMALFRNAIVKLLDDIKDAEIYAENQMQAARKHYQSIVIKYLRLKIYENYRYYKPSSASGDILAIENVVISLDGLYSQGNSAAFESKLAELKKSGLLTDKQIKKVLVLKGIVAASYRDFKRFEDKMVEFRKTQFSKKTDSLYNLLPEVPPRTNASFTTAQVAEQKVSHEFFVSCIESAIKNNFSSDALQTLRASLKDIMHLDVEVIETIINVMQNALADKSDASIDLSDPRLTQILADEDNTVLDLVDKLDIYAIEKNNNHRKLKEQIVLLLDRVEMPSPFKPMLHDHAKITQFRNDIVTYRDLTKTYVKETIKKNGFIQQMQARFDLPLIHLLRAQVLHAAKLYFNPTEKPGWFMHALHHGSDGDSNVCELIYGLFSPDVKSFMQAVGHIRQFIDRHANSNGLHTNSFDTLLSYVLYNEGAPRGIFKMPLADMLTLDFGRFYPGYRADDLHFRGTGEAVTKIEISGMKSFLCDHYPLPVLDMKGSVSTMVRGQQRLKKEDERNIVRQQMKENLGNMANLIEQFKAGKALDTKTPALQAPRP